MEEYGNVVVEGRWFCLAIASKPMLLELSGWYAVRWAVEAAEDHGLVN